MICGFKTKIRNSLSYIRVLLVIAIVVLLVVPVFAETYDTDTLTLSIEVSSYGAASDDCDGGITLLTPLIEGSRHNPKAQAGYHYAYGTCGIEIQHNNPDTIFDVFYRKTAPASLSDNSIIPYTFNDIDHSGVPPDCSVDTTGNTDEEKFGYRLTNVSLPAGVSVQEHGTCEANFDAEIPGDDEFMFAIIYSESNEELIIRKSTGDAICGPGDCTFDIKATANVAWETAPVTYFRFEGAGPFTTKVLVSEQP